MAMAFSVSSTTATTLPSATAAAASLSPLLRHSTITLLYLSYPNPAAKKSPFIYCDAAKQPRGPVKKRPDNKRKKKKTDAPDMDDKRALMDLEDIDDVTICKAADRNTTSSSPAKPAAFMRSPAAVAAQRQGFQAPTLPKPPAGFVVDDQGRVLMASNKRIATIVDPTNNYPLECIIRRVFRSSHGDECMLLCPVDTPVQILKSTNIEGWSAVSDEEVEAVLPTAAYALAKIHMHLVYSGFCYTARGAFCYTEDDIFDFRTDDGEDVDGLPTEGVEITSFHQDGSHYMIYTPSDPLLFVAVKDHSCQLQIADDELLEDPAIVSAIDEETEFNALVEEEAALLESLFGER